MKKIKRVVIFIMSGALIWALLGNDSALRGAWLFDWISYIGVFAGFVLSFVACLSARNINLSTESYKITLKSLFGCSAIAFLGAAATFGVKWLWQNYDFNYFNSVDAFVLCIEILGLSAICICVVLGRFLSVREKERERIDSKKEEFFQICPELRGKDVVFTLWEKSMDIDLGSIHLNVAHCDRFPRNTRQVFGLDREKADNKK